MRTETKAVLHGGKERTGRRRATGGGAQQGIIATTPPGRALHGPACVQQLRMLLNGKRHVQTKQRIKKEWSSLDERWRKRPAGRKQSPFDDAK